MFRRLVPLAELVRGSMLDSTLTWTPAGDLRHIYAVKEFERQVYARLGTDGLGEIQRVTQYSVKDASGIDTYHSKFLSQFPRPAGLSWNESGRSSAKLPPEAERKYECDLYLRCCSQTSLDSLFKDCCEEVISLTLTNEEKEAWPGTPIPTDGVVLCEFAETPQSLRSKLWQLERAVRFGPKDLQEAHACVVCLNGELPLFQLAANAAKDSLTKLDKSYSLPRVRVYALWTPYRNTYAEIGLLNRRLDETNRRLDNMNSETNRKLDNMNSDTNRKLDAVLSEMRQFITKSS